MKEKIINLLNRKRRIISIEYVKYYFTYFGYKVLNKDYITAKKIYYVCSSGHSHSMLWNNFTSGHRCPSCHGNAKFTIDHVKSAFKKCNYTLLSIVYVNDNTLLDYICDNGHTGFITYNNFRNGKRCGVCAGNNKGGVTKLNIPLYETYALQLETYQKVFKVEKVCNNITFLLLGVECAFCKKIFVPKLKDVQARVSALSGKNLGEANLYCSARCKKDCSTYNQKKYPKYFIPKDQKRDPEVSRQLRALRLVIDKGKCQVCFSSKNLECHHLYGVQLNPTESADLDCCATLCYQCHKNLHKTPGYTYQDFKRKPCNV